jgi:ABC-type branched-subunit amino acid transport system permease subunit
MALTPVLPSLPLVASSSVAFGIIFGIFVAALLVLIVIVVLWAVRRDRAGRALWRQRQQEGGAAESNGSQPPRP